jgi:hypothetical protein
MNGRELTAEELRLHLEESVRLAGMYGVAPAMMEQIRAFGAQLARIEDKLDALLAHVATGSGVPGERWKLRDAR